jgi:mannitol/fructose-specific phosphotransferase system IIA component (Ntr-type)
MLSRISRILRDPSFRKRLIEEGDDRDLFANIVEEDKKFGG